MDLAYHERPFYSWRAASPDTVAELEAAMQRLNQTPCQRKQTVALEIISDHAIRSRQRLHLGRFLMLYILPVAAMMILCVIFITEKSSGLMTNQQVSSNLGGTSTKHQVNFPTGWWDDQTTVRHVCAFHLYGTSLCYYTNQSKNSEHIMLQQTPRGFQVRTLVGDMETLIDNLGAERNAMIRHQKEKTEESATGLQQASLRVDLQLTTNTVWLHELQLDILTFRRMLYDTTPFATDRLAALSHIINKMTFVWLRAYPETNGITFWKSLVKYLQEVVVTFHCIIERDALKAFSQMEKEPSPLHSVLFHRVVNTLMNNWFSTITQNASPQRSIKTEGVNFREAGVMLAYNISTPLSWPEVVEQFVIVQQMTTQTAKEEMLETIAQLQNRDRDVVAGYVVLIFLSLSFLPLLACSVRHILLSYNRFIKALNARTQQVKAEEMRAKSVMCQFMPAPIANSLSQRAEVNTEFFNSATILFADIHGVSSLISKYSPTDIITTINCLFTLLDKRIEKYDTYRMEIVGESYMISSGVPRRNGNKHVTEIANLALDLVNVFSDLEIIYSPESRVSFKLGIHTGPCVAALIGASRPRYRLIGETVGIASRMELTSLPNKIQISSVSQALLAVEDYFIQPRGLIEIKGRRKLLTYWLIGRTIEDQTSEFDIDEIHKSRRRESFSAWSNVCDTRPSSQRTGSRISVKFSTSRVSLDDRRISTVSRISRHLSEKIPTIEDFEFLYENKTGSPVILQLTEGIHY